MQAAPVSGPKKRPLGLGLIGLGSFVFLGAFTNVPWEPHLRPWLGRTLILAVAVTPIVLSPALPLRGGWAATLAGWILWLPTFVLTFHLWPSGLFGFWLFYGYPKTLSPLEAFVLGGACLSALLLGTYALGDHEYRPATPRLEAMVWIALTLIAVSLCALAWLRFQSYLGRRPLGDTGIAVGIVFLLAQMTYCWTFELRAGWLWLRDVWLLWTPVFAFFLITDVWGHLLGAPPGLGEFLTGGAGFGGLAIGAHVIRLAIAGDGG